MEYSVIDPLQRSLVNAAARSEGAAADKQDAYKRQKYKALLERTGYTLMPASQETTGRMSKGFYALIDACSTLHDPATFSETAVLRSWACRTFKDYWTQRLAISFWFGAVQMANQRNAVNHRRGSSYIPPASTATPRSPGIVDVSPAATPVRAAA